LAFRVAKWGCEFWLKFDDHALPRTCCGVYGWVGSAVDCRGSLCAFSVSFSVILPSGWRGPLRQVRGRGRLPLVLHPFAEAFGGHVVEELAFEFVFDRNGAEVMEARREIGDRLET
jgi:hypothetical protein